MAVIGTIRKQSGLLVIIVGLALAAFVLGDFLKPRSGRQVIDIAEVYGEEIPISVFNERYEQNLEAQKRNQNKEVLTPEEQFQLKQQTYDQMVQEIIVNKEYDKLGLEVTADELFEQIQGDNPHPYILQYFKDPQTQQYDPELVRNYIAQLGSMDPTNRQQWDEFVKAIKEDRLRTKYKSLISKAYYMPDTFLVADFNDKKIQASVRLVGVRFSTVADSLVTVTDEDLKEYYDEYKQNYKQEVSRDIQYVIFNVTPSAKDRKNIRDDVFAIFEDFKTADNIPLFVNSESDKRYDSTWHKEGTLPIRIDSVVFSTEVGGMVKPYIENDQWHMARLVDVQFRPDSMKASHILLSYAGAFRAADTITRSSEQAKELADSLANVLMKSPTKMETLAESFSDDPSAAQNKGDLGWFADGSMVYPFNHAVLTHKVGDITVVESQFGYHVIKVTGKQDPVKKVRVAVIDISITPSQETFQTHYAQASEFQGNATDLESFDTLAANMNLSVRSATYLQPMANRIAGLDNPRQVIQWAYTDGIDVGSVSYVFTMEDKYVVAAVTKIREEGIPSLDEIRENLEPLVLTDLKGDKVVSEFNDVLSQSSNLSEIAQKMDSKVDSADNVTFNLRNIAGFGNESDLISKIFTVETGQLTGPVKGNNAAFVFIVDEFKYPDPSEDNKMYKRQLLMNFQAKVNNNSYLQVLEDKADIVDNRVKFF
ncbi:MAG: peptidylprolyl isomerase [Bacteroidetes bacterium]|nr:peptidylprolyl isomerase [Bacteroidota bacterium]